MSKRYGRGRGVRAQVYNYTICEGSVEAKTEEDGAAESTAAGCPTRTGHPTIPRPRATEALRTTVTTPTEPNLRKSEEDRTTGDRTTGHLRMSDDAATEPNLRTSEDLRTSGPPRVSGRPAPHGRLDPGYVQFRAEAHVPLHFAPLCTKTINRPLPPPS